MEEQEHDIVSRSFTESEYRALEYVSCEVMGMLKLFFDLNVKNLIYVKFYCDNDVAIKLTLNLVLHEKIKHFKLDAVADLCGTGGPWPPL